MKLTEERPFASVDAAVRKLLEIANGLEPDRAGRLQIGTINAQFLKAGASVAEYKAALRAAVERGLIALHASGAYLTFTQAGRGPFLLMASEGLEAPIQRSDPAGQSGEPKIATRVRASRFHKEISMRTTIPIAATLVLFSSAVMAQDTKSPSHDRSRSPERQHVKRRHVER